MRTNLHHLILGLVGAAALTFTSACSRTERADREMDSPSTADRIENDSWMSERNEYIARRENELNDIEARWQRFENRASAESRQAWNEVKEQTAGLRRELSELKAASRETWEEAKGRMDAGWERFEDKVDNIFGGDNRPNR